MGREEITVQLEVHRTWLLLCGMAGGYLLLMLTNPVRRALADGWRAMRRYPTLWVLLGVLGFCNAAFDLGQRVYFHIVLPRSEQPEFIWAREAWRDAKLWITGSPESLWWLPREEFAAAVHHAILPALESVAGIFNMAITTFPVAAFAAVLFLVNWEGHHAVLLRALRKRFGFFGWLVHLFVIVCALAAISKPLLYAAPLLFGLRENPAAAEIWFQWAPVVEWLAFLFEYLFGVFVQLYLILLAYIWVRGLTFTHQHLIDLALRRFSFVMKWAAIVMLLSSVLINAPLILKNFNSFAAFLPEDLVLSSWQKWARTGLAGFLLLGATIQITLTFHSESLRRAIRDHLRFVLRFWWPFAWFLAVAGIHFFALHLVNLSVLAGVGEGTALWVFWKLVFPWPAGIVTAWLLGAWVSVFHRCDLDRVHSDNALKHRPPASATASAGR